MRIFVFGSSITSSYWNGAATYYRGIYKNLHALGHDITFAEPDAYGRQHKRDLHNLEYAEVVVYRSPQDIPNLLARAAECDLIVKHSGVGVDDESLEQAVLDCRMPQNRVAFWDVDAPATLARVEQNPTDPFRPLIPLYDFVFTYGGGDAVVEHYRKLGANGCYPIYNALDPDTHFPVAPDSQMSCDLVFVGNRLPDREQRVQDFFFAAAELAPDWLFILGGEGWGGRSLPPNVRWIGHIPTADHNRINCSARMVLNINRDSMASVGFSPPTRVFEAAGAGACLITDAWAGIERFFQPEHEILVARDAQEVLDCLRDHKQDSAAIGRAMRERALADHTYAQRACQFDTILQRSWDGAGNTHAVRLAA
jgi:spore maturation protein CgeB